MYATQKSLLKIFVFHHAEGQCFCGHTQCKGWQPIKLSSRDVLFTATFRDRYKGNLPVSLGTLRFLSVDQDFARCQISHPPLVGLSSSPAEMAGARLPCMHHRPWCNACCQTGVVVGLQLNQSQFTVGCGILQGCQRFSLLKGIEQSLGDINAVATVPRGWTDDISRFVRLQQSTSQCKDVPILVNTL